MTPLTEGKSGMQKGLRTKTEELGRSCSKVNEYHRYKWSIHDHESGRYDRLGKCRLEEVVEQQINRTDN